MEAIPMKKLIFTLLSIAGIALVGYGMWQLVQTEDISNGVLALVGILMVVIFSRLAKKTGHTQCPKCGYKYDYDNDVAHHVNKTWDDGKKEYVLLDFECECRKCGHEIKFKEKYVTQEIRNGRVVEHDVLGQIRKYFK